MRRIVRTFQSSAKCALRPAWRLVPLAVMGLMTVSGVQSAPLPPHTASNTFNVTVNLTPACTVTPAGNIVLNYTSFGAAVNASTTAAIKCTASLPYTLELDLGSSGSVFGPVYLYTDSVVQLAYGLQLSSYSGTGSGIAQTVTVNATIGGNQGGLCAISAGCSNALNPSKTRTLTVSY